MVTALERKYKYEVRTAAGALVNKLPYAHEGKLTQEVNQPTKLTFKSPIGETGTSSIIKANEIYLTDPDDNVQVFRMINRKHVRDSDGLACIEFTGYDYLAQLGEEQVLSYHATVLDALTIDEIIDDLFALQLNANPITVGTIDAAIGDEVREILINNQTILQAIRTLQTSVGGYFWVDEDRQFNWRTSQGNDSGQQIRYGKNATSMSRDEDYSQLCTRLYAYGIGEGGVRLDLTDAGEANEYIDGTTQGTYGIVPRIIFFKSTLYADFLLAQAEQYLAEHENPIYKYNIDFTDLSMIDDGFSFDALALGSCIKIIDEDLSIDNSVYITRIDRNLDNPEDVKVNLSSAPEVITTDVTSLLAEKTKIFEGGDAVIVSHDRFYVNKTTVFTDWMNGTQTAICGDYIRTGAIESNNWGAGAGTQIDLTNETIKIGGSSSPKFHWNGTTLAITGNITISNPGDISFDDIADGSTYKKITAGDQTKLGGIETGADVTADHNADVDLANVTGDLDDITDGATYEKVKATSLNAGNIELNSVTVINGKWYSESGVEIDADEGIDIYGQDMAFTTSKLAGTSITGAADAGGGDTTFTTSAAHGMEVGDQVVLRGMSVSAYNGKYTITAVGSSTTFDVTLTYSATATGYAYEVQCSVDSDGKFKFGGESGSYLAKYGLVNAIIYTSTVFRCFEQKFYSSLSSNTTLLYGWTGMTLTNGGASGTITLTLPTIPGTAEETGIYFDVLLERNSEVRIKVESAGDSISLAGTKNTDDGGADGYISASNIGDVVRILCIGIGEWLAIPLYGTWSWTQP